MRTIDSVLAEHVNKHRYIMPEEDKLGREIIFNKDDKHYTFRCGWDIYNKLVAVSKMRKTTIADLMREILREWIKNNA